LGDVASSYDGGAPYFDESIITSFISDIDINAQHAEIKQ
jgi:hypothetical protein